MYLILLGNLRQDQCWDKIDKSMPWYPIVFGKLGQDQVGTGFHIKRHCISNKLSRQLHSKSTYIIDARGGSNPQVSSCGL